jgi:Signal peptide peptidase.
MPSTVDTSGVAAVPSQPTPTVELTATDPGSPLGVFAFVKVLEPHLLFLMLSSLTLLWIGAHSALRRPPSAAPTESTKQEKKKEKPRENLEFSDAILFPLCLGVALAGMYYVIKVLQYADIVNSILRVYMSVMSIAGTGTLIGDALDIYTSLIFPDMWADQTGRLYHIDQNQRRQLVVEKETGKKVPTPDKTNPLPGKLSEWRFSPKVVDILWGVRGILNQEWSLRFATYGKTRVKIGVRLNDIVKVSIATALAITYHFAKGIFVSNLLAIALCYSSFSLISPTSFAIGTLVLGGLFVYDIVMVFYTYGSPWPH